MADPTATVVLPGTKAYDGVSGAKMVGSEVLVTGAFVGELFGTGELQNLADEPGAWPTGYVEHFDDKVTASVPNSSGAVTGTNLNTDADYGATVQGGVIVTGLTVAGATSYAKKGEPVFATDGQTLTLTRPSDDAVPMGFVYDMPRDHTAATNVAVYVFGKVESWMLSCAGGNKRRIVLCTLPMASIADTSKITHTLWGHGRIVEIGAQPIIDVSTGSKATTLTCSINAAAITTGALALTSTGLDTPGTAQSVTPTAANEFHDGDVFNGQFGSTTTFGEGYCAFYIDVEYLPGA